MVGIIDYGMGNLLSVYNAFSLLGADVTICHQPEELDAVERIVLPGVGSFGDCMVNLARRGFVEALQESVVRQSKPIFGICLGMQVMARRGYEGGVHDGLGWFDAEVARIEPSDASLRVPHVGWNDIQFLQESPLFAGLPANPDFYFVHSYAMKCDGSEIVDATCDYGGTVTAAVRKNNIFATQFHPEKSQEYGQRLLQEFLRWNP